MVEFLVLPWKAVSGHPAGLLFLLVCWRLVAESFAVSLATASFDAVSSADLDAESFALLPAGCNIFGRCISCCFSGPYSGSAGLPFLF